jgi:hypothetical protein
VGNYVIANPSNLGNFVIADTHRWLNVLENGPRGRNHVEN